MSAAMNITLVRRFFEQVCNGRNMAAADELFAKDHRLSDPSFHAVEPGPEGIKQALAVYHKAFPDAHWWIEDMIAEDDKVVARWVGRGTHKGTLEGDPPIPATNKPVEVTGIVICRLRTGYIVETWSVWDTWGMLRQLGVVASFHSL